MELIFLLAVNWLLCYILTTSAMNMMSIGDIIYNLSWYELSRDEQFIVQTIIRRSQKAFELKALGVFACSLEIYLKVSTINLTPPISLPELN